MMVWRWLVIFTVAVGGSDALAQTAFPAGKYGTKGKFDEVPKGASGGQTKAALPTKPLYRGGFRHGKLYPNGFGRIVNMGRKSAPPPWFWTKFRMPLFRGRGGGEGRADIKLPAKLVTPERPDIHVLLHRLNDPSDPVVRHLVKPRSVIDYHRRGAPAAAPEWLFAPLGADPTGIGTMLAPAGNDPPPHNPTDFSSAPVEALPDVSGLATGDPGIMPALRSYHSANPDDFSSTRVLAVGELVVRRPSVAAALMREAYTADSALVNEPMDLAALGFSAKSSGVLLKAASSHSAVGGQGAWLLLGVLQQATGHPQLAAAAVRKAKAAGLEAQMSEQFLTALAAQKPPNAAPAGAK